MANPRAYIIAARRTALGRIGGLHRARRLDALTTPLFAAVLADARLQAADISEVILGVTAEAGNPARLALLAAGLPETCPGWTIDRHAASGLDAVLAAVRAIESGNATAVIAGGADALSMAPWRVARPRGLHQTPHFIDPALDAGADGEGAGAIRLADLRAARAGIARVDQDNYALRSHRAAQSSTQAKRLAREIVALKPGPAETHDECSANLDLEELAELAPLLPDEGTATAATVAGPADGAALLVVVDAALYARLGSPPALCLLASAATGVAADAGTSAPVAAMAAALARAGLATTDGLAAIEMCESSAIEALELVRRFKLATGVLNPAGGALVRGCPAGAAGAVGCVRLVSDLLHGGVAGPLRGAVVQGASAGLAVAAVFETVGI